MQESVSVTGIITIFLSIAAIIGAFFTARYAFFLQYRKTVIGIRQNISQLVDPKMLIKPKIVFIDNGEKYSYSNLFIVEAHFFNRSKKGYAAFHINAELKNKAADIIFASCQGHGGAHKAKLRRDINFDRPSKVADIDLKSFYTDDRYSLTLYIDCPEGEKITIHDILYDSENDHLFKSELR